MGKTSEITVYCIFGILITTIGVYAFDGMVTGLGISLLIVALVEYLQKQNLNRMTKKVSQIDGKFYQECDIVVLPTDNPNPKVTLFKNLKDWKGNNIYDAKIEFTDNSTFIANMVLFNKGKASSNSQSKSQFYNLYFISDEEIKEGERTWIYNISTKRIYRINPVDTKRDNEKVIIATTDKELQERGLPQPSNEFLKAYYEKGGIKKVLIEVEQSELWDDVFRVLWNRDVSEGTKEAMIREKYKISLK